jgi:hypothetical protein
MKALQTEMKLKIPEHGKICFWASGDAVVEPRKATGWYTRGGTRQQRTTPVLPAFLPACSEPDAGWMQCIAVKPDRVGN